MSLLAGIALEIGANVVGDLLRKRGGKVGGVVADVADAVVRDIAGRVGVEPTEAAIAEAYDERPAAVETAITQVNADMAAIARAEADAMGSYHELIAADGASESWITRSWRPINGILFALASLALTLSFVRLMWIGDVATIREASVAYGFLGTVLGTWAGVVGVYAWRRTTEKTEGLV